MMEVRLLSLWDGLVESVALIAIVILALCVMVRAVKRVDAPRHLGVIAGIFILLLMLPPIIIGLWSAMSFGQHIGLMIFGAAIAILFGASHRRPRNPRRR